MIANDFVDIVEYKPRMMVAVGEENNLSVDEQMLVQMVYNDLMMIMMMMMMMVLIFVVLVYLHVIRHFYVYLLLMLMMNYLMK
jgi:hypothetical protein